MGQLSKALEGIELPKEAEALVSKADGLLDREAEQTSYVQYLETKIKRLEEEKGISGVRENLAFNDKTGTYVESPTGVHHCTKCLMGERRVPLKNEKHGWRCMVCTAFYDDPDRPPQPINYRRGGSWMAS